MHTITKPKLIMMIGLSGSGKSTYATQLAKEEDAIILSSDSIREELYNDVNDQRHNQHVFQVLNNRVEQFLSAGTNVIYDATNLNSKRRSRFLSNLTKHNILCTRIAEIVITSIPKCVFNDASRERSVGHRVILKQLRQFQPPYYTEGWDLINITNPFNEELVSEMLSLKMAVQIMEQDNPYHSFTVGRHNSNVQARIEAEGCSGGVYSKLGLYHDLGKYYTKTIDENGVGHFYGHAEVSAYLSFYSFFYTDEKKDIVLQRAYVISLHMRHYSMSPEKYEEWLSELPAEISSALETLCLCDYDKDENNETNL